jgi:hypothetical protein
MKRFKFLIGSFAAILAAVFIYSCTKETDKIVSKDNSLRESRSTSLDSRYYNIRYIDSSNQVYSDYNDIETRINGSEHFKVVFGDSYLTKDSLIQDTLTPWPPVIRPCCDLLIFNGWGQLPFPPYTGIIGFTLDRYSDPSAIYYYQNLKLWVKDGNNWVLNYNWNWLDFSEDCKSDIVYGSGFVLDNQALGCPYSLKKIRLERRWKDDNGVDHLCTAVEGTFYFPGYPWTPPCF